MWHEWVSYKPCLSLCLNRQGSCRFPNANDHIGVHKKRAHPRNTAFLPAINISKGSKQRLAQLRKYRLAIEPIAAGYVLPVFRGRTLHSGELSKLKPFGISV
jgi:hypothetical protein